ncbi:MAG: hypothetical protein ACFE0I_24525 [Elainellaceae cyanobacterium]
MAFDRDNDRSFSFNLPDTAHLESSSVLFLYLYTQDADELRFWIQLNAYSQVRYVYSSPQSHTLHEVIDRHVLEHGANTIRFVVAGKGTIEFGDVVLFWQRNI